MFNVSLSAFVGQAHGPADIAVPEDAPGTDDPAVVDGRAPSVPPQPAAAASRARRASRVDTAGRAMPRLIT
jgi:hypothetical protein